MKKILLGAFISFTFALLIISCVRFFISVPKIPNIRDLKVSQINGKISTSFDIKDKVAVQKTTNQTNYLNSWKLSATVLGQSSFAMVLKGKNSKVLRIKDTLEGYEVIKIEKDKVLFSTTTNDVWLYIKVQEVKRNNIAIVAPQNNAFVLSKNSFRKNIQNPERLLNTVNIMPEMQGNRFEGMKVANLQEGSFLYVYGLRKGDIIKKINNKKLLSIADGISAYQNIASSSKFTLSVLRDNQIKELRYEVH